MIVFDFIDDESMDYESTDEGFFRATDPESGLQAEGISAEDALCNLAEESDDSFCSVDGFDCF